MKVIILSLMPLFLIYVLLDIFSNNDDSLAKVSLYLSLPIALICFFKPTYGLYFFALLNYYNDFYKKLATYYGYASMTIIIQVLAVTLVALAALTIGALRHEQNTTGRISKRSKAILAIMVVLGGIQTLVETK